MSKKLMEFFVSKISKKTSEMGAKLEAESRFIGRRNRSRQGRLRLAHENFRRGRWAG